jgi:hypothetical protein
MSDSLDDQTAHAKVFSSHCYEKQYLMKKMMTQSFQTCVGQLRGGGGESVVTRLKQLCLF